MAIQSRQIIGSKVKATPRPVWLKIKISALNTSIRPRASKFLGWNSTASFWRSKMSRARPKISTPVTSPKNQLLQAVTKSAAGTRPIQISRLMPNNAKMAEQEIMAMATKRSISATCSRRRSKPVFCSQAQCRTIIRALPRARVKACSSEKSDTNNCSPSPPITIAGHK